MKSFKISYFSVMVVMTFAIATTLGQNLTFGDEATKDKTEQEQEVPTSLSRASRFLSHRNDRFRVGPMTCDRYPKVCRLKGIPGRDCCRKRCVDLRNDRFNCGKCGKKCRYSEICCKGKCVNPMFDKKHCGGCFNKCKKESSCSYGMCSYA